MSSGFYGYILGIHGICVNKKATLNLINVANLLIKTEQLIPRPFPSTSYLLYQHVSSATTCSANRLE